MASITVDIQAKVVGYEASLKAMKDAFSKIDPGSDIGKSLEKAIKYAEGQLKNLNKNLTPKASSDTQIDSIIEKTNRAGEAIQEVSALMQKVTFGDIDFSSFENGISNLMSTLRDLESELDSRVSKGLQETIANSSELINSFSKLDIDVKDKSAGQIFEAVSEKARKAAEDTEAARVKLEAAQKNLNSQQGKLNQLESNPIYNKDVLEQDLQNIAIEYTKTFDEIKNKIQEGLRGLLGSDSVQADKLMENFMNGLNPQTLKDHLMQLKNELQQELSENNSAKDIYTALLGDAGQSGNAQAITTKLLSSLNQSLPQLKEELQNKVQDFISSLTNKEAGQITTLISLGDIEKAVKTTIQAVERAYDSVKGAVVKKRADVASALKGQETAQADFDTAQQNQQYIEGIQANLQQQIDELKKENSTLQERIDQLVKQIQEKKDTEEKSIRKTAVDSGSKAGNLKVSADEARMYRTELQQVQAKEKLIGKIEGVVQRWFSIYAAVRMVGNAIRSVISTVKELDKTITEIAIVTNMTQNELWGQMKSYTDMARQYAASISGVYQVSQLYYQQGLQTADVMALTEETLKMARISGLGYAEATDYMTNAVRSFKMEMTDAQRVVDVYSEIAASSATSTSELASAMSKTASSAAAVGSSFENTTAMMAVMIEATREAPENIGSAMKSIISRYGEMKADPTKLIDSEGQEMSLNKVDKALQSVGISIQDANHQFRDFDDVITELASKWDTIDTNTQRYIATVMAGNRQQSRFLALVSNGERLAELSEKAANSEDTATLQVLKTMDSIEAKTQQLKTSLQSLYTSTGIQNLFKGFLDDGNQIVKTFTQMPTVFGAPIPAILKIGTTFASLANIVTTVFGLIKAKTQAQIAALNGQEQAAATERVSIATAETNEKSLLLEKEIAYWKTYEKTKSRIAAQEAKERVKTAQLESQGKTDNSEAKKGGLTKKSAGAALGLNIAGVALSTISGAISDKTQGSKIAKGLTGIAGSAASMAGLGTMIAPGWGTAIGAALGGVMGIVENINFLFESAEARATRLKEAATEAKNKSLQENAEAKDLNDQISKLKELEKTQHDSVEARKEYLEACNQIAAQHPELVSGYTSEGDAVINLTKSYEVLAEARQKAYEAAQEAAGKSAQEVEDAYKTANDNRNKSKIAVLKNKQDKDYSIDYDNQVYSGNYSSVAYDFFADQYLNMDFKQLGITEGHEGNISDLLYSLVEGNYQETVNLLSSLDVQNALTELSNSSEDLGKTVFKLISDYTAGIVDVDRQIESSKSERDIVNQSELLKVVDRSNQLRKAEALKDDKIEVLQELPDAGVLISNYLSAKFEAYQEDWDNEDTHTKNNALEQFQEEKYQEYYDSVYKALNEFWEKELITDSSKERFAKILGNRGKYTQDQLIEELGIKGNEELEKAITQYYQDAFSLGDFNKAILLRWDNQTKAGLERLRIPNSSKVKQNLGGEELQTLLSVYDQVANLIENHKISPEIGQKAMNSYMSLWEATQNVELFDDESREAAQELISGWDDFSLAGLDNFRKAVASSGLNEEQQKALIESAENFSNLIPKNFTIEIASFAQKVTSNIEDFEKAISSAAKGMDLKAATEMAQKLGKSLSDFDFKDGKFFFDDFATIRDAYLGENEQYIADLTKEAQAQATKFNENKTTVFSNGLLDLGFSLVDLNDQVFSEQELRSKLEPYENQLIENGFTIDEIVQAYSKFQQRAADETDDFVEWVGLNINKELEETIGKVNEYTNDQIARTALSTGNFSDFLGAVGIKSDWGVNYYNNLLKDGEIDTIINRFPEYASDILKYYQNINKNVYDKLISGLDSQQYINADEFSAETLQSLETAGLVKKISGEGSKAIYKTLDKMTDEQLNLFAQTIANSNMIEADKQKMLASIHTEKYENNVVDAFSSIVGSFDSFSYEAGQKLALALGKDLSDVDTMFSTDAAGNLIASYDNLIEWLNTSGLDKTSKQYNDLRAKLEAHQQELSTDKILTDIVQNRDKLNEENLASLAQILKVSYDTVIRMVHQNADGTYTINLATLVAQLDYKQVELSDAVIDLIANQMDAIISSITGLAGSQSKGFTDLGNMQKYVTSLREKGVTINGEEASLDNLFEYNESLRAYQLSSAGIIANIQGNKQEIDRLRNQLNHTSDTDARAKLQEQIDVAETFINNSVKEFADAIDLSSFLDADFGSAAAVQAEVKIKKAVEDYNSALLATGETAGINADKLIDALKTGGEVAVKAMEQVAKQQGKTLSASDIESAYRGQISKWVDAIDTIVAKPGEIVDVATAGIIGTSGGIVNELGDTGQFVVESAANLYEAYNNLLRQMALTGEATLADLNKVAGLALDNKDGQQVTIDALGDAANLTYSRLGEIFTSANKLMTEELVQDWTDKGLIKALGGNKIQITDFTKFADLMGFDTGSPEYISAFKTYNESLIDMNRKAEKNILEEAQSLGDMKAGDWIDLTQFSDVLNKIFEGTVYGNNGRLEITALDDLNTKLINYGAYLENGILKTVDGANIPAIIQEIANNVQQYGNLSELELAQLADTLKEILKSYADLISGAIEGSLSNEGAQQLQQWAESVGLGKLNFQETREGLRLSTEQAYKLYQEIAKIDGLQGQIVFDNLAESLRADKGGDFSSATKTLAAVPRIQAEIKANLDEQQVLTDKLASNRATEADKARLKVLGHQEESLKRQKALYQSIAQEMAWSNMDNPDSYNFMNQSLPDVFQGPINYWNSVGEAFGAMNEAGKTGKMDIQDFYNIVGEMSNLAAATGSTIEFMGQSISGDLESAANLIEKGFNSLSNVDGKGVKVDMAKLAANLDTGATDMGKGFDSAVNKMASAQVHMLDAMIKVLETIVAMEKLGEVDVDNNGLLSVGEIFDGENFTPLFDGVREYLLNSEALEPLLDDLRVHGVTLRELLDSNQDAWRNAGISEQEYANIMSAFYQAALSDNYDLDSLVSSVMNVLGGTGQVFSYYDKESGVETIIDMNGRTYSIDWNEEEDKKRIYDAFEKAGYDPKTMTDEEIREILQQGQAGELTGEALIAYEISYGIISEYTVTNEDGSETTIWKDSYGNTYENEKDAVIGNALAKQQNQAEATSGITEVKMGANDAKRQSFQVSGGLSYDLTVDVDGKEIYSTTASDNSLVTAKTYPEMINALLNKESLIETGGHLGLDQRSEEDILRLRRKFGVEVTPDIIFRDSSGQEFNPENDPNIKTQLGQFLNRSHESIEKSLEHTDSGTYVATLFDGSQLEVKAENTDEAIAKLQTALDPITTSISTAITNAFTNSDTGVSEAIGNAVASAITNLTFTEDQTPEIPEISATVANVKITKIGGATYEAGEENVTPPNIDSLNATVNSLKLDAADIDVDSVAEQIQEELANLEITIPIKTPTPAGNTNNGNQQEQPESGSSTMTMNVVVNDEASSKIDEIQEKASSPVNKLINADADGSAANKIEQLNQKASSSVSKNVDVGAELTQQYNTTIAEATKSEDKIINIKTNGSVDTGSKTGNVALAKGTTGAALAGGRTLMGELGPELVVSKGRYFVVGQNGPEMVNLAPDAIVFNHLQTRQLLASGKTGTHATPVTNERKATSFATGNASGPAMASASAALAALKQLRAMWQSLVDASLKDLGGMPGGSGGGGGGGGGDKTPAEIKSITQQVERWYNWMKEIEEIQTNLNKLSKEYTLLEKQHIASQTKLANLQNQQAETLRDINTRSGLVKEQKDYRSQEIARVTKEGSAFNAFYGVDEKTGRIYLKNDDTANAGFKEFLKGTNSSLGNVMVNEGKISAGTKIKYKGTYDQEDADKEANVKYQKWLKSKKGKKANQKKRDKQLSKLKDKASKNIGKKEINKTLTTKYDIRTGADLMNELQRKDKQGNNVHNAQEQYLLLDKLGIIKKMPELMAGIDKSQEGWQETAVENFYNAIDADKEAIETLTDSINEQEEALLDDKIQMQEINDQIREIAKPLPGVTEGFEQWYNELKRIEAIQERINILSKQNNLLQNDHIANGKEIFLNLKQQDEELKNQLKANEDLYNKQVKGREDLVKKYQSLPIDYDASTGTATFNEKKYNQTVKASYTETKKNSLGYEVDKQGRYVDNKGILRDASGKELNPNTEKFGEVQTTTINSTYKTNGKTLPQILEEITSQKANGETAYNAEQQYNILKDLGFEDLLQYDESGKQIYENFGELSKEQMKEAVEAGISRIQGAADKINESTSGINKLTEENLDIQNQLYENESARIQNAIDLENLVKDAIVQERQNAIDEKKDLRDVLDKAANKTVDGLKKNLDREKALYDSDSDSKELTALQAQLALLRSAGGSLGKIRDLESQIQAKQKDMYFAERENSIENLENAAQKQIDALDTQIDIMQTSLDWQVEHGMIWEEVNQKISDWGPDKIADYIITHQKDFLGKSPTQQGEDAKKVLETAQFGKSRIEDAKNPQKPKKEEKPEPKKNQEKKESKPEPKKEESKNQSKTTSQPVTQPKAQTNLTTQQQNALKADLQPHLVSDSPKDRPKTTEVEEPEKVTVTTVKKGLKYYSKKTANSKTKSLGKISKGTSFDVKGIGKTKTYTTSKKKKRYMLKAEIGGREVYVPLLYTWLKNGKDLESKLVKSKLPKFAKGGSVDFTGPAWVDGTKNKPEQIFNYDQMEQLRKMFLDNLTATQIGIAGLSSIADKLPNTNSYNSINNENSGVNIDQLDFHMEVEQISNDYDARRAGQAAMEEMVRIARKTGNRSISRR